MPKKCKVISFGKINRKILLILLGGILYFGLLCIESVSKIFGNQEANPYPIVYTAMYSFSISFSGILLIVYNIKNKKKNNQITSALIENTLPEKKNSCRIQTISLKEKFLWILLVSAIDYISNVFSSIYWASNESYVNTLQANIVFMAIFAYFILKMKLYRHHYLCITIIVLRSVIYPLIFIFYSQKAKQVNYLVSGISFATDIMFSLTFVLYKYYMLIKYINPYEIMFYEGVFELIFSIITLIITTSIDKLDNFVTFFKDERLDSLECFILFSWMVMNFSYVTLLFKVIDIFSPFYLHLSIIISEFIFFFINLENYNIYQKIFYILSILFCSFMILIFIEIVELNFCGLSYMTKKNIEFRARLDCIMNRNNNDNNDDEDETIDLKDYTIDNRQIPNRSSYVLQTFSE